MVSPDASSEIGVGRIASTALLTSEPVARLREKDTVHSARKRAKNTPAREKADHRFRFSVTTR